MRRCCLFSVLIFVLSLMAAQAATVDYVSTPTSYLSAAETWHAGQLVMDDEEFFISRVRPKQLMPVTNGDPLRQLWFPAGDDRMILPSAEFDTDVFSAWNVINFYGDHNTTLGWIPGCFADAAHRNGVGVSGMADQYEGATGINDKGEEISWYVKQLTEIGPEKIAAFLLYHGVDCFTLNTLYVHCTPGAMDSLKMFASSLLPLMKDNPAHRNFLIPMEALPDGSMFWSHALTESNSSFLGTAENPVAENVLFYYRNLNQSIDICRQNGRDPSALHLVYELDYFPAKFNDGILNVTREGNGVIFNQYENIIFNTRLRSQNKEGRQQAYIHDQNSYLPQLLPVSGRQRVRATRSTLSWDLGKEPMITHFTLGNGMFFNSKGERESSEEWSNIGLQDYLPSWRFWWSRELLGASDNECGLKANFTWEDAYCGGSSIKIEGTNSGNETLHLFRTGYSLKEGDQITLRYKHLNGDAKASLVLLPADSDTPVKMAFTLSHEDSDMGQWQEVSLRVSGQLLTTSDLEVVALEISDAERLDMLLGEFSIIRSAAPVPATPTIESCSIVDYSAGRIAGKIRFSMATPENHAGSSVANLDVATSNFRLWAQQEGKEPIAVCHTGQWAAVLENIPVTGDARVRFGVQAIGLDWKTESPIAWSEYTSVDIPYRMSNSIVATPTVAAVGEPIDLHFADPNHPEAYWRLINASENKEVAANVDALFLNLPEGVAKSGVYDLELTGKDGQITYYPSVIEVTGGCIDLPSLQINGENVDPSTQDAVSVSEGQDVVLGYTSAISSQGRSNGLLVKDHYGVAVNFKSLFGNVIKSPFSFGVWLKPTLSGASQSLLCVGEFSSSVPFSYFSVGVTEDGKLYSSVGRNYRNSEGTVIMRYDDCELSSDRWIYLSCIVEMDGKKVRIRPFVNAKEQFPTGQAVSTTVLEMPEQWISVEDNGFVEASLMIDRLAQKTCLLHAFIGGNGYWEAGKYLRTMVDDAAVWNVAADEDAFREAMNGFHGKTFPKNLVGYWSMEAGDEAYPYPNMVGNNTTTGKDGKLYEFYYTTNAETAPELVAVSGPLFQGCPYIEGVSTLGEDMKSLWSVSSGRIMSVAKDGNRGEARLHFDEPGLYEATLTLDNGVHRSYITYPVIAYGVSEIEKINTDESPIVISSDAHRVVLNAADKESAITASIIDLRGVVSDRAQGNGSVALRVPSSGVYILKIDLADRQIVKKIVVK